MALTSYLSASFAVVAPVVPPTAPIVETVGAGYEVFIRDADMLGLRSLPPDKIGAASWTIQRLGGYDDFSLSLNCRTIEMLNILTGDRVEVWHGGKRQCRGWITERTRQPGEPDKLLLRGYGRLFNAGKKVCDLLIIRPAGQDIRTYFQTIATAYVLTLPGLTDVTLEIPTATGYQLPKLDSRGKTVAAVFGELCEATSNTYVWGFDVDPTGQDRLYLRQVGYLRDTKPGAQVIAVPGPAVIASSGQVNTADVVNRLRLTGATPKYPNSIPNASFENPTDPDPDSANLLVNGGFEDVIDNGELVEFDDLFSDLRTNPASIAGTWVGSSDYAFVAGDFGRAILVTGGSGWVPGYYRITEVGTDSTNLPTYGLVQVSPTPSLGWSGGTGYMGSSGGWELKNGASITPSPVFAGSKALETDHSTEYAEQSRIVGADALVPGHTYRLRFYARPETDNSAAGEYTVSWRVDGSWVAHGPYSVSCVVAAWEAFYQDFICPTSGVVDGFRVRVSSVSSGDSMVWDNVAFYDADVPTQDNWVLIQSGGGSGRVDWDDMDSAVDGGYGITMYVADAQGDADPPRTVSVSPKDAIQPITAGATYILSCFVQCLSRNGETDFPQGELRLIWRKQDGTQTGVTATNGIGGTMTEPDALLVTSTAPPDAVSASIAFVALTPGVYRLDAFTLMDLRGLDTSGGVIAPGDDGIPYQPDGAISLLFRAEDLVTVAEDADVHNSYSVYGWREARESEEDVDTIAEAKTFAKAYFLSRAKGIKQPTVTPAGADKDLWTTDTLRLEGVDGPSLGGGENLPVARIKGQVDSAGLLTRALETGKEQPTLAGLMRQTAKDEGNKRNA